MSIRLVALLLLSLTQGATGATVGNVQAGKALWEGPKTACKNCHGPRGEGGFGPDLAGRQLSFDQFKHAVRRPWGVMPTFTEEQVSDRELADLVVYFTSLTRVAEPGPWRTPLPAGAPKGQQLLIASFGCGQCHGPLLAIARQNLGGMGPDADYAYFAKRVYEHTSTMSTSPFNKDDFPHMGNFSRTRLPEPVLQELWRWVSVDLGFRVPIRAQIIAGAHAGNGASYALTVENRGVPGKGLAAEDISIALNLVSGATVGSTTGAGYQGIRRNSQTHADAAVWQLARLGPGAKQTFTIALSGNETTEGNIIKTGSVSWTTPPLGATARPTALR
jgi:mono/diheme cytochrome c family protein